MLKSEHIIPYGTQHITQEDIDAVVGVLHSKFLTQGPNVKKFEEQFASYVGAAYAVAVTNGTAALHLSAMSLGVNNTSKVITTPITFSASANCIRYCGGEVVFADIDPQTALLDITKVRELIQRNPKGTFSGIIPVDFAGYPVNLEAFRTLANEHGLWLLEDSCHAPGAYFRGQDDQKHYCGDGSLADLSIFSFHPVKHIATGEGGMVTTNSEEHYKKLLKYRSHGMVYQGSSELLENHGGWYMEMQELGYNYRISDINAALGISQLKRAEQGLLKRHAIAKRYDQAFEGTSVKTFTVKEGYYHGFHLYIIQVEKRRELYDYLREHNVFAQVHYVPVHLMPYYQSFGWKKGDMPAAEAYYEHCLSIPMYPTLTEEEQSYVIDLILNFK